MPLQSARVVTSSRCHNSFGPQAPGPNFDVRNAGFTLLMWTSWAYQRETAVADAGATGADVSMLQDVRTSTARLGKVLEAMVRTECGIASFSTGKGREAAICSVGFGKVQEKKEFPKPRCPPYDGIGVWKDFLARILATDETVVTRMHGLHVKGGRTPMACPLHTQVTARWPLYANTQEMTHNERTHRGCDSELDEGGRADVTAGMTAEGAVVLATMMDSQKANNAEKMNRAPVWREQKPVFSRKGRPEGKH
ncbi:hypothetical protein FISHEDRAFT_57241 [Fistulina hepatica ATCC 64428]|nr:hypothetical protein FISHEDRAFT_57241 [Fistulina hepatica ATCC 64428]